MTRNTRLFRIKFSTGAVTARSLTVEEVAYLDRLANYAKKCELAATMSIMDSTINNYRLEIFKIGEAVLENSVSIIHDPELFELTVQEFRNKVNNDTVSKMMLELMSKVPGTTFDFLLSRTHEDLMELMCMCEVITGKKSFNFSKSDNNTAKFPENFKTITRDDGRTYFEDDGKSIQEKMKEEEKHNK